MNNQEIDQAVSVFNDLIDKVETGLGSLENLNKCLRSSTDRAKQKILEDKQKDFEKVKDFFESMYASGRLGIPLKGLLIVGY